MPVATPIAFPICSPIPTVGVDGHDVSRRRPHLTAVLQGILRPHDVTIFHLRALGVHVRWDGGPADLIPDPASIPDFDKWHALGPDDVHTVDPSTRRRLNTGTLSPGCQTYLDRVRELNTDNEAAFRTVRRTPPPMGQAPARLGNSFDFFRHLELFTPFWDDTSQPAAYRSSRTDTGSQMPPEYRQNMVAAFLKLVAYDFGCNVSAPRTEPRLSIRSEPGDAGERRRSYFPSGCTFIFRTPTTRDAARAGIVEGPLAAVSARHTTSFPAAPVDSASASASARRPDERAVVDKGSVMDLAREVIAALITAQHRAREGRTEKRVGDGEWWTTKPRWGGGTGGPIGREVDVAPARAEALGDKDGLAPVCPPVSREPSAKGAKRVKKSGNLAVYDNYRRVRPPAAMWDRKTRYEAIGRTRGADYDDVFVVSALFHHVAILRVRVPDRLLAVLDGAAEPEADEGEGEGQDEDADEDAGEDKREQRPSWGRLEIWRSPWYDLFRAADRVAAVRLVWAMMAFTMRGEDQGRRGTAAVGGGDAGMADV